MSEFERATMSTHQGTPMINDVKNMRAAPFRVKHVIFNVWAQRRFVPVEKGKEEKKNSSFVAFYTIKQPGHLCTIANSAF